MNDLIERLNEITAKKNCAATTKATIAEAIEVIQSKSVHAVPEGQWLVQKDSNRSITTCSNCGCQESGLGFMNYRYCPVCGANMMG